LYYISNSLIQCKLNVILNTTFLRRNRKFALLVIVVFAAILTPPDVFSQILMAIPLLLLYELGIFMVYLARRKDHKPVSVEQESN